MRITLARAATVACLALVACTGKEAGEEEAGTGSAVVRVGLAKASVEPFTETVGAIGTVTARAGHFASLSAPAEGRVARVLVTVGERVGAGQALVELEQAPFASAARSAEAALAQAQQAHERAVRLAGEGIVPRKDVEQAAADLARARADAEAARRAERLSTIRSPIAGVVTRLDAALGATADASRPLVDVTDPTALDLQLAVSPADAARLRPGAIVTLGAAGGTGGGSDAALEGADTSTALGAGVVGDVAGTVDSATRSVAVRVRITASARPLRVGETVDAEVAVAVRPRAVVVPLESLVPEGEGFKVFVVDSASVAHATPVAVGGRTARVAEITHGLRGGEVVVTYGAYGVADSAKVAAAANGG